MNIVKVSRLLIEPYRGAASPFECNKKIKRARANETPSRQPEIIKRPATGKALFQRIPGGNVALEDLIRTHTGQVQ